MRRFRTATITAGETDQALFAELYPQLRRFAAVVGDRWLEPDDLVQEALVRTLTRHSLSSLDYPAAYLRKTILNTAIDLQKRQSLWRRAAPKIGSTESTNDSFPSDLADLDHLNPIDRAVLYLVDVEGYSHPEAAEFLDLTHDAIRLRASRARKQLRVAINEERNP